MRQGERIAHAASGQRPGDGDGADHARVLRHVDRARQRHARTARPSIASDRIGVPPDNPSYTLRRVWLTEDEERGYYYGFANEGPVAAVPHRPRAARVSHERLGPVRSRQRAVCAGGASKKRKTDDPIVLVQDYHFALLPRFIHERLPKATIITFWHIPWPNPESFGICPWRKEVLEGLLGSTILGFHTQYPLPQLHRHGRPLPGGAHRLRELDGFARRASDEHRAVSRFRSNGRRRFVDRQPSIAECRRRVVARRRYSGRRPAWHRRRPDGLHEGHHRALSCRRADARAPS